ncbi:anaerobic regulatory protein [Virgibacillus pantothenticus]|uniref:Crp/Fnr family transcriptional regulator n=1 Tax=Virgibacillus pantothenticus TaxID=1473 RepID=A0A0L0QUZ8_VIRPA|nr:Crp/Fnr family transcriptional regulator [Virgibacillus pantothenticus]KNE22357.1 Crp/Fnr family transcriptional regulator [Virgibacillus pantothenticus]MEB5453451.1 Crp/Fnr family transcriptional regulator [Virgibacillus pantothenticus]MEB5457699.1 Crp/Fnr family transcriptional regulator [Virgibacillus pantothenticus]MEB5461747.1 Crp/Fnr family transcriptional regulator [Virgibacillus pantothenticus]MEB5465973.1 Crp/Fnr family transcriptional regulator [Virgibacillus pantothenticus]
METNLLKKLPYEKAMIPKELHIMLNEIGTVKPMHQGRHLFHEGEDAHEIYLIRSGQIQIDKLTSDGKELTLRICNRGDIVGELTLFSQHATYFLSAKVIESGEVVMLNKDKLERELLSNPALTLEFMKWSADHMRKFQTKIRDLLLNGKKGALYSTLIRLSNSYGVVHKNGILIDMVFTNRELAQFCAARRESINRMLSELKKMGVISMEENGKILIKNIKFLRDEIGCEYCPIELCNIN